MSTVRLDPQEPEPALEAYVLLNRVTNLFDTYNRYDLREHGLTVPQFAILNNATPEGVPLSELSAQLLCDNSNLTGIVDRLVAKGLVERRSDPQDRRVTLIRVTPRGQELLRRLQPRHHARVSRRMHTLAPAELHQLRDLLNQLYTSLQGGPAKQDLADWEQVER